MTSLFLDPLCLRHDTSSWHPEQPARLETLRRMFAKEAPDAPRLAERDASDEEILRVHTPGYLRTAIREITEGHASLSTGDTEVCPESLAAARRAAGGVLAAVDDVMSAAGRRAFCAVRPPGHHATPTAGMGFCIFNNIAIGARHARAHHGVGKVAIVDWDVHHGNGTQDTFYEDGSVFFFSLHQSPWYPGTGDVRETGRGKGLGTTMNRPLPAGTGIQTVRRIFTDDLLPALDAFRPELVMISAGFDSRVGDPLGQLLLEDADFAELTLLLREIAARHAGGRVVSVLEGGYSLDGLSRATAAHWHALAG